MLGPLLFSIMVNDVGVLATIAIANQSSQSNSDLRLSNNVPRVLGQMILYPQIALKRLRKTEKQHQVTLLILHCEIFTSYISLPSSTKQVDIYKSVSH